MGNSQAGGSSDTASATKSPSRAASSKGGGGTTRQQKTSTATAGYAILSPYQRKLLIKTWPHVHRSNSSGVGQSAFNRVTSDNPNVRDMFARSAAVQGFGPTGRQGTLSEHVKMLTELLDQTIKKLTRLEEVGDMCIEYGMQHSHLSERGLDKKTWDNFGQAILESITQLDTVRKHKELVKAWTILVSFIVDKIRQGYDAGVKKAHQQASAVNSQENVDQATGSS